MVRVKKRASKRQTTKQREKVNKKVREHHRKQRREAKRNPNQQWRSRRRDDPGIPNSFPFKEQLLSEIEHNRHIAEVNQMNAQAETRGQDDSDASSVQEEEQPLEPAPGFEETLNLPHAPILHRSFSELVANRNDIQIVIYVLDARDPISFESSWLQQQFTSQSPTLVFALSRADCVPQEVLTAWVYRLMAEKHAVFPVAVPPTTSPAGVDALAEYLAPKLKKRAVCVCGLENVGKTSLATALQGAFQENKQEHIVFDTPALLPSKLFEDVGDGDEDEDEEDEEQEDEEQEDEEQEDEEQEDEEEEMEDEDEEEVESQHIMLKMALQHIENQQQKFYWTLCRNQGNMQRVHEPEMLVRTLLSRVAHPEDLMLLYNTPAFGTTQPTHMILSEDLAVDEERLDRLQQALEKADADTEQFLLGVARSVGRLKRKGVPDTLGAARRVLRDWSHAAIGYYAKPYDRVKTVQTKGSKAEKQRWNEAQDKVARLSSLVLPRKNWREVWHNRELRLNSLPHGVFDQDELQFAEEFDDQPSESDEDQDDVPVYGEDSQESASELEEQSSEELQGEPEPNLAPTHTQLKKSRKTLNLAQDNKSLKRSKAGSSPSAAPSAPRKKANVPKPGEAYNLQAYF
ncbi:hypothetical protein MYAM1_003607 [Malassezia yamatoensis]|uniref:Guanine nucleotide-binding protein-like 3 N-terminal domain-containing protein n=1 Tax=Malassezia yamatoensis TaxID=253288 RepID=A0AAJ5YYA3_9BASI|nr:hypothetical protein MYAM1_003607 [Malassezia yamatoensis]